MLRYLVTQIFNLGLKIVLAREIGPGLNAIVDNTVSIALPVCRGLTRDVIPCHQGSVWSLEFCVCKCQFPQATE